MSATTDDGGQISSRRCKRGSLAIRRTARNSFAEVWKCLLSGDLDTGKAILRDYINATMGFEELSDLTRTPSKSLMRMLGPKENPQARNILDVIAHLQRAEGLHCEVSLKA